MSSAAVGVSSAGLLPGPTAPVTSAAPFACSSANVSAPGVVSPAGAAPAAGRHECAWESPRSEWRRRRSSSGESSRSSKQRREGRSPSPARSSCQARASASFFSASSDAGEKAGAMPPPPAGCLGMDGGRSRGNRSASGRDCSPQPGPSGLGLRLRSSPGAGLSHSEYGGRSSPALGLSTPSIWIGTIRLGLSFTSSGISTGWRNRQV